MCKGDTTFRRCRWCRSVFAYICVKSNMKQSVRHLIRDNSNANSCQLYRGGGEDENGINTVYAVFWFCSNFVFPTTPPFCRIANHAATPCLITVNLPLFRITVSKLVIVYHRALNDECHQVDLGVSKALEG